ncbi:VanZ family protein [Pradoshia sp.]
MDYLQRLASSKIVTVFLYFLLAIYLLLMCYLLFFGYYRQDIRVHDYNVTPFETIKMYIVYMDYFSFHVWFINLFGNIIAFMPLGLLLPLLSDRWKGAFRITILSFFVSLTVETIQLTFHVGRFDVDDMLLNTIGGLLGYVLLQILQSVAAAMLVQSKVTK